MLKMVPYNDFLFFILATPLISIAIRLGWLISNHSLLQVELLLVLWFREMASYMRWGLLYLVEKTITMATMTVATLMKGLLPFN